MIKVIPCLVDDDGHPPKEGYRIKDGHVDPTKLQLEIVNILAANAKFYTGFRDYEVMNDLWAQGSIPVFCLHPGQEPLTTRETILASWKQIIDGEKLDIAPATPQVLLYGGVAVVTCNEIINAKPSNEVMVASNIFVVAYNEFGWAIVGHHAGRKS